MTWKNCNVLFEIGSHWVGRSDVHFRDMESAHSESLLIRPDEI